MKALSRALIFEPLEENSDQDLGHGSGALMAGKMLAAVSRTVAHVLGYWVNLNPSPRNGKIQVRCNGSSSPLGIGHQYLR